MFLVKYYRKDLWRNNRGERKTFKKMKGASKRGIVENQSIKLTKNENNN